MELDDVKLNQEEFEFYVEHLNTNPKDLIFKKDKPGFSYKKIAVQLQSRNKSLKKLPNWANHHKITYPKQLSLEQCSSEKTASYKQDILPKGEYFADLTGGFGVDTAYISKNYSNAEYYELNSELAQIVNSNFKVLNLPINVKNINGVESITNNSKVYDLIYLDPARRKEDKKVFRLEDCTPNLIEHQKGLLEKTQLLCSKHSPLLDLDHLQHTLHHIKSVYIISVLNECKEILVLQDSTYNGTTQLFAVNILADNTDTYSSEFTDRHQSCETVDEEYAYIYIPNSSILKAGLAEKIAQAYQLKKFSANTHFYLSNSIIKDYPGRCFEILLRADKIKTFKKDLNKQKRDVICRNSSYKPDDLAKKLKLIRGNDVHFVLSGKNKNQTTCFFDCKRIF